MSNGFSKKASSKVWETWTTDSGVAISVNDMTESHAKNVLNLLLRRNKSIQVKLDQLKLLDKDLYQFQEEDKKWGK